MAFRANYLEHSDLCVLESCFEQHGYKLVTQSTTTNTWSTPSQTLIVEIPSTEIYESVRVWYDRPLTQQELMDLHFPR